MKNEWISVEIKVKGVLVEAAAAVTALHGCCGTLIEDRSLDTFEVPETDVDPEGDYGIVAYFNPDRPGEQLLAELRDSFAALPIFPVGSVTLDLRRIFETVDWSQHWKQNFSSFRIGDRLIVHPSWEKVTVGPDQVAIEIDPGMAFGTGTHATTRLCLEAIAAACAAADATLSVLDVGTGSGILAIGAAALGCSRVVGTDIDPAACDVARQNVDKNHCADRVEIVDTPLEQIEESFDLVVANILAEENIRLKGQLLRCLRPGGRLVLSGILKEKEIPVAEAFAGGMLRPLTTTTLDEWVCLVYQRG